MSLEQMRYETRRIHFGILIGNMLKKPYLTALAINAKGGIPRAIYELTELMREAGIKYEYSISKRIVTFPNGSHVVFTEGIDDKINGYNVNCVWHDESREFGKEEIAILARKLREPSQIIGIEEYVALTKKEKG